MRKAPSTTQLRKKLWTQYFSPYIRLRDKGVCYTCRKTYDPKICHAGHFVHKDCLDFNEKNVHCQCYYCNLRAGGNLAKYAEHLEADYGQGIIQELNRLGDAGKNWKVGELLELIEIYKEKLKVEGCG
jgi:hypothetical protein